MAESATNRSLEDDQDSLNPELGDQAASTYAARLTTEDTAPDGDLNAPTPEEDPALTLPPAKDHAKLRLAASDMVEFGISLDNAAAQHVVDRDTLHIFYRTYVQFVGKENVPDPHGSYASNDRGDFDRSSHRQFDRNWAEMMAQANLDRPQLTGTRRWLVDSPLTSWIFNGHIVDKLVVTGAACVIAFGLLVFAQTRTDSAASAPPLTAPLKWTPGEDLEGLERDQQIDLLDQILAELRNFIEAKSWKERLPLVRHPDAVAPLMERYYQTNPDGPMTPITVQPDINFIDRSDGKFALVRATLQKPKGKDEDLIFLIEMLPNEKKFLIDWQILVNYEPLPWEDFRKARNEEPSPFRVKISQGDYYNQPFMDDRQFLSLRLSFFNRPDQVIFGYARRDSEVGKKLQGILDSELDKISATVLNLKFPKGSKYDNILEIESVAADTW